MKRIACALALAAGLPAIAQQPTPATAAATLPTTDPSAPKPRVFVTDSDSWQVSGGFGGAGDAIAGTSAGGARPQTAEVIKTLGQRCPQVIVNNRLDATDYVIRLEHEGGKGMLAHKDKVAVFVRKSGDSIFSKSTLSVGGAVQDSCTAITSDWATNAQRIAALPDPNVKSTTTTAPATQLANLTIDASIPNSDIEIDGNFVGSTPSTVSVPPGQHTITVKKKGYTDWTRTMSIAGPSIHLNADLEQTTAQATAQPTTPN